MDFVVEGSTKPAPFTFDSKALTLCDREAIHAPGAVQPHGALLALDRADFRIVQAGGDTKGLLGAWPQALLGTDARELFSSDQARKLVGLVEDVALRSRAVHPFSLAGDAGSLLACDVVAYHSGEFLVLEFDPRREAAPDNPLPILHAMLRRVHQADSMARCCQAIVDEVRGAIGFDHVMLYRFLNDGSGEVVAEAVEAGAESFLGLRYPESDIPKQARELYRANWLRAIPDARYSPAPILSLPEAGSALPLDLSNSVIRSVSPVHRQYLANMGVVASLSMSIVMQGRLWGLIACHHRTPRYLPYSLREAFELFAEMVSAQLERLAHSERLAQALRKESELRAAVEGDLTQLLRRTVTDQETERQRIARELHDTLGQSLTMLQLGLQAIGHEVPAGEKVQQRLNTMKNLASTLGRDVNRLAFDIRPASIDDLGIQNTIESLLESWSETTSIKYGLHLSPREVRLATPVETVLYRVLQETLANVVRHANASTVGVVLSVADGQVSMIVEDDGRGFPADYDENTNSPALRLGLIGIRERLVAVGGTLEIETSPGCGTTVFVRIPTDG
jgi:light-regulated signal transduction histidine kinase (bacteriophytochrome)